MKYFGIGLHKTGTTTLGQYFKACDLKHHLGGDVRLTAAAQRANFEPILDRVRRFDSFEDAPWFLLYRQLWDRVTDSRFILTVRSSPDLWLNSMMQHVQTYGLQYPLRQAYGFPTPKGHEQHFLEIYEKHTRDVQHFFSDKPGRLLTICFESPDAKATLLRFMDKPDLDVPSLHANKSRDSAQRHRGARRTRASAVYLMRVALEKARLPIR